MKSYLSKFGVLLLGAMFAVAACQDYDEDIRQVNDKLDETASKLTEDLDKAIADLEAKHAADLSAVEAALKGEIAKAVEEATASLEEAYKAADEALKKSDAALQTQINEAVNQATTAIEGLYGALEAAKAELKKGYEDGDKQVLAFVEGQLNSLNEKIAELEKADKENADAIAKVAADLLTVRNDLDKAIESFTAQIQDLQKQIDANKAAIADLAKDLADAKAELEAAIAAEEKARLAGDKNLDDAIKAETKAREEALKLLAAAHEQDIKDVKALIESVKTALETAIANEEAARKDADEKLQAAIDAEENARKEGDDTIVAKLGELRKELTDYIAKTDTDIQNLKEADAKLQEQINKVVAALEEFKKFAAETYATKDELNALHTHVTEIKHDVANEFQGVLLTIEELNKALAGLQVDVDALIERVQSIVYVPEYSDHKATLDWAIVTSDAQTTTDPAYVAKASELKYLVKAEDAASVAESIAANPEVLDYVVKGVQTRSEEADLEIVNVEAKGEYLIVKVVAKNFARAFYQRHDEGCYSAALVLSDENNTRTTEYTNLVPGNPKEFKAIIVDGSKEQKNITFKSCSESEPVNLLPYDRDPAPVVVLKNHQLVLTDADNKYTKDQILEMGYDLNVQRTVKEDVNDGVVVGYLGKFVTKTINDLWIMKEAKDAETGLWNTVIDVTEITAEQYLALKKDDKNVINLTYTYDVNGLPVWTESTVEICNRLVKVEFNVDVPWTFETALSTVKNDEIYAGNLSIVNHAFDLNAAVVNNKTLAGYSLATIIKNCPAENKSNGGHYDIALKNIEDGKFDVRLQSGSEKYAFPKNDNNDETNLVNSYSATWRTDFEDLTIYVKVVMNLGEQAPAQSFKAQKTFTPVYGFDGQLRGTWNPLDVAFASFVEQGYIKETSKDAFVAAFEDKSVYATPTVNGKDGNTGNTNPGFELGENTFILYQYQLGNGNVDGTSHVIAQKVAPFFGIDYTFELTANVDLGDYVLDTDEVRVINDVVNVLGEIEGDVYTVNLSDLAKYYYVVNKSGVKELKDVNGGDNLSVKFVLSPMDGAKEAGFHFNGTSDVTEYTLPVDWTKDAPYILEQNKAVVNWGTYPYTEVGVNAILSVNGFPVAEKAITLVTEDPLKVQLNDVNVSMDQFAGDVSKTAKIYEKFVLTSSVEPNVKNLFNTGAATINDILTKSKADITYSASITAELLKVYYKDANGVEKAWDMEKLTFGGLDKDTMLFDGTVSINPDDANIETPIYVKAKVVFSHNIHNASKESCETVGEVILTFTPKKK